jgi:tetratricopeptide (TPR) repeat protein
MFATKPERWATKIEILNHYLKLLFYPTPLSSDYSYNTIPYTNFGNGWVWMSLVIHLAMIAGTVVLFFRRNILAFALAFYLLHLFLISNFLMDIGATMGERLVYHSSFGFALIIGISINWCYEKFNTFAKNISNIFAVVVLSAIIFFCVKIVIPRNREWKNDTSLFIADAETVPNSAMVNGNAGKAYIDLSEIPENKAQENDLLKKAIYHLSKSVAIHKKYVNGYLNLGVAYFKLKDYEKAKSNWEIVAQIFPNNPFLKRNYALLGTAYYNESMKIGAKQPQEAIKFLKKAVEVDPNNVDYWYNLGGACYTTKDYEMAKNAWTKTLQLDPNHIQAKQGMAALPSK